MSEAKPSDTPEPQRLGVREFRGNMAGFLRQVREGRSFLIMSRDEVLAELRPPAAPPRPARQPGALRGKIRMAPDFDALPPDLLAAMEGEAE
ncbi:MAG: prevent-host-death protein [Methylobacteriaceae bacterium]|jgi:antitoxin (DNA-binding transcriptional repressor) of toxin-antitoxin stability system|nr:prevent-host-death protein [Methylobacterium sp. Leaf90]